MLHLFLISHLILFSLFSLSFSSSWALWSSLGLYPQSGNTTFALTSPVFPLVIIHRPEANGGTLEIQAPDTSDDTKYVEQVVVNGNEMLRDPFLRTPLNQIQSIQFTMTQTPTQKLQN